MIAAALMLAVPVLAVAAPEADRSLVAMTPVCAADGHLASLKIAGETVDKPLSPDGKARIRALIPRSDTRLFVAADMDTPYHCIGALIYNLQVLGYRTIGFISEPPPGDRARR